MYHRFWASLPNRSAGYVISQQKNRELFLPQIAQMSTENICENLCHLWLINFLLYRSVDFCQYFFLSCIIASGHHSRIAQQDTSSVSKKIENCFCHRLHR